MFEFKFKSSSNNTIAKNKIARVAARYVDAGHRERVTSSETHTHTHTHLQGLPGWRWDECEAACVNCGSAVINEAQFWPELQGRGRGLGGGTAWCMLGLHRCSSCTLRRDECERSFCGVQATVDSQHTVSPRATPCCSAWMDNTHTTVWLVLINSVPSSTRLLFGLGHMSVAYLLWI